MICCPFFLVTKWQPPPERNPNTIHNSHWYIFSHTFFWVFDKKIEVFLVTLEHFLLFWGENIGQFFSIKKFGKNFVSQTWGPSIPIIQNGISNGLLHFNKHWKHVILKYLARHQKSIQKLNITNRNAFAALLTCTRGPFSLFLLLPLAKCFV